MVSSWWGTGQMCLSSPYSFQIERRMATIFAEIIRSLNHLPQRNIALWRERRPPNEINAEQNENGKWRRCTFSSGDDGDVAHNLILRFPFVWRGTRNIVFCSVSLKAHPSHLALVHRRATKERRNHFLLSRFASHSHPIQHFVLPYPHFSRSRSIHRVHSANCETN